MGLLDSLNLNVPIAPNSCVIMPFTPVCDTNRVIELSPILDSDCPFCFDQQFKFLVRVQRTEPAPEFVMQKFVDVDSLRELDRIVVPICEDLCQTLNYRVDLFVAECISPNACPVVFPTVNS